MEKLKGVSLGLKAFVAQSGTHQIAIHHCQKHDPTRTCPPLVFCLLHRTKFKGKLHLNPQTGHKQSLSNKQSYNELQPEKETKKNGKIP